MQSGNSWEQRCPHLCKLIEYHDFDIFGTQEGLSDQLNDIINSTSGYAYIGVGRDDGKNAGEYAAVFYKTEKFELLDSGNFWIAEDTSKPNLGWDAACIRICTWGKFREKKSNKIFLFFNLHMDHVGVKARSEGAKLIFAKIKEFGNSLPAVLTGDFNIDQDNESYTLLNASGILRDAYDLASIRYEPNGTFNNFNVAQYSTARIDHIFLRGFDVSKYAILTDMYWVSNAEKTDAQKYIPRIPSDHYPVVVDVTIK